jgi:hypothetical protein
MEYGFGLSGSFYTEFKNRKFNPALRFLESKRVTAGHGKPG